MKASPKVESMRGLLDLRRHSQMECRSYLWGTVTWRRLASFPDSIGNLGFDKEAAFLMTQTHTHTYTHAHKHLHTYTHLYAHTRTRARIHSYTHGHTRFHTCKHAHKNAIS